jgi:large subunit ribosomal protein L11
MAEFCKQFNEATDSAYEKETPLQVQLAALSDRSFTFKVRSPPTSYLIKKAAGITKGPSSVNPESPIGYITPEAVYEIAKIKIKDDMRWHLPLEGVAWSVIGTAKSIGIHVREASEEQNDADETVSEGN